MKYKIMLINPPRVNDYPVVREERFEHKDIGSVYPPLSLLYMAAVLEKNPDFEIKLLDANGMDCSFNRVNSELLEFNPDMVISRYGFDTQEQDSLVLRAAKDIGAFTVLRSKIIADVPIIRDKVLEDPAIDVFIDSEPESVVMELAKAVLENKQSEKVKEQAAACLRDPDCRVVMDMSFLQNVKGISYYDKGSVHTTQRAEDITDLDSIPFPAYHLLESLDVYHTGVMEAPFALVQTTRGCPFACTFCAFGKTKLRYREVDKVIEEIKLLKEKYKIKSLLFFDDTISLKEGRTEELAQKMIDEGLSDIEWVCCTRANLVNFEMLKLMKEAGMKEIAIGIETGSEEILRRTQKGVTLDDIRQVAKWCKELKIMFYGLMIIGLPGETKHTVAQSVRFIKEIDPFYTQICFATPFPNTDIYNYYKERNLLLTEDWGKYFPLSEEPVIATEDLKPEQLKKLRRWAYMKLLFRPLYLMKKIRPFDWKWNVSGVKKIMARIMSIIGNKPVR